VDQIAQAFNSTAQAAPGAAQPITGQELLLQALGAIANPQRAISVPDTTLGRLSGLLSRGVGGIAGAKAEDLQRLRLDPLTRRQGLQQQAIEAFKAIPTTQQVPIQAGGELLAQATPRGVKTLEQGSVTGTVSKPIRSVAGALRRSGDPNALLGGGLPLLTALVGDAPEQFTLGKEGRRFEIGPDGRPVVIAEGAPATPKDAPSVGTILEGIAQATLNPKTGRPFNRFSEVPGAMRPGMRQRAKDEALALKRAVGFEAAEAARRAGLKAEAVTTEKEKAKARVLGSGARFVDPNTFEVANPTSTKEQAILQGKVEVTPKQLKNLAELDGLKTAFSELKIAVSSSS